MAMGKRKKKKSFKDSSPTERATGVASVFRGKSEPQKPRSRSAGKSDLTVRNPKTGEVISYAEHERRKKKKKKEALNAVMKKSNLRVK